MGSIPLPALGIKTPEIPGVLDQYKEGLGVKALMDQQKLRGQQIQTGQNVLDEDAAIKQAVQAAGGDARKALPQIMQISPEKGIQLQKQFEEWDTADITKKKSIIDLHAKKAERVGQLAGTVTDPESRDLALKAAVEEQLIAPNDAAKMAQQPFDLQTYKDLQTQGMTAKEQHDATSKELDRQDRLVKEKTDREAPTGKEKDFQAFYAPWLEANDLPKNAKNEMTARKEFDTENRSSASYSTSPEDIKDAVISIKEGKASPVLSNYSFRDRTAIAAGLQREGFNQAGAERDWKAINRHLSTLNGAQQERLRQSVTFAYDSLPVLDDLYKRWQKLGPDSGFKVFNRASMQTAKQLPGEAGAVATALDTEIADFTSELGTVYKGGNASTDSSLALAAKNLSGDWNEDTFKEGLKLARTNLGIRRNSILTSEPAGVSPTSPYIPPPASPATAPAGAGAPAGAPSNDPFGWRK
jgi:hypothetical protein